MEQWKERGKAEPKEVRSAYYIKDVSGYSLPEFRVLEIGPDGTVWHASCRTYDMAFLILQALNR